MPDLKLQFSTTSGLISGIVRTVTWSRWSHVDCILTDGRLLGAQWDGVKIRPADYEKFSRKDCLTLSVTDSELATYMAFLTAQVGKKYDYSAFSCTATGWSGIAGSAASFRPRQSLRRAS